MEELAAGRHAGLLAGSGELAHDDEVRRAVHDLQKQRQQHREGKGDQGFENAALGQILIFHGTVSSCGFYRIW